ncbi:hypothetical protein ES703_108237 [subsurface metagenome]
MPGKLTGRIYRWWHKKHVPPGDIKVARYCHHVIKNTVIIGAIKGLLDRNPPVDSRRLGCCIKPGSFLDFLRWHPGNLSNLVHGIFINPLDKLLPAVSPFLNKFPVVKPLVDDYIQHTKG